MNRIRLDEGKLKVFRNTISAMQEFKREFNRDIQPSFVGELYAAERLGLEINPYATEPGFDATDSTGRRYQIKYRNSATLNVDTNNFNFDYIVLVNLSDEYQLTGMWLATVSQAKKIFTWREKFRKYQVTQKNFKSVAQCLI